MQNNSINIINSENCCGCGACSNICPTNCISFYTDREGFSYPSIDKEKCIECGLCLKSCPAITQTRNFPQHIYAVKSKDIKIQYKSSSGGAFQIIATAAIKQGYKVYGAVYSEDFTSVRHCAISSLSELHNLMGSKYVQSDTLYSYKKVEIDLKAGLKVLYSGVGCQIQGLKNYLRKDYDNLLTIDILCHGVPSPKLFSEYICCISNKYGKIKSLNMKDKTNGWGHQSIKFELANRIEVPEEYAGLWNKIFISRVALRPSCHNCKFASSERCGDLTLGDYWGIEKSHPKFWDRNGVSLVLVNTSKGKVVFDRVCNDLSYIETSLQESLQPVLVSPTPKSDWRNIFWDVYYNLGFKEVAYKFWNINFQNIFKLKINRIFNRKIFK